MACRALASKSTGFQPARGLEAHDTQCRQDARALRRLSFFLITLLLLPAIAMAVGPPTVVFMSDFGTADDSVAVCKGVMIGIEPDLRIIDITHEVSPYSIRDAARFLAGTAPHYGPGTVFLVVVDPGVGSERKPIVARSGKNQYFVLPDNGLITLLENVDGIEGIREIKNEQWMIGNKQSSTFHGRDIFAPVAAHLAAGKLWTEVGPEVLKHVRLEISSPASTETGLSGEVIGTDGPYGNLITNITADRFGALKYNIGDMIRAQVGTQEFKIPFVKTFSDVPLHQSLFYIDSRGRLGIAMNQGNFAQTYHVVPPAPILIYTNSK